MTVGAAAAPIPKGTVLKYNRVVCIYPYRQEVPVYEFFPPLGLEYVAAAIQDAVGELRIIDLRYEKHVGEALAGGADLFCVSVNWHYEFDAVCEVIRALPPEVTTVVGGKYATDNVEELFARCPNIDVIVRGDGEEIMRDFVAAAGAPEDITGLSFRRDGEVVHNANRDLGPVSNALFPDRRLRRYTYKVSYQKVGLGYTFDSVLSSQGCPFNCKFCSFKLNPLGQKRDWSARTPESVVAELHEVDAGTVAFVDDNFFADIERVDRICDLIIAEKLKKVYVANARISIANYPALLKKMYAAGFRLLMVGLESAQDKSLQQLNKGFTTADAREAFEVLRESNILINGYFIVGIIGETEEEMLEIAPFARELGVDLISPNRLRYEKYSGLKALLEENADYYVGEGGRIYSKKYGRAEINRIVKQISADFFDRERLWALARKGLRIGFPGWPFYLRLPVALPRIISRARARKRARRRPS